jgi:hypothetical protein
VKFSRTQRETHAATKKVIHNPFACFETARSKKKAGRRCFERADERLSEVGQIKSFRLVFTIFDPD